MLAFTDPKYIGFLVRFPYVSESTLYSIASPTEEVTQMQYDLMDVVELSTVKELLDYICENS